MWHLQFSLWHAESFGLGAWELLVAAREIEFPDQGPSGPLHGEQSQSLDPQGHPTVLAILKSTGHDIKYIHTVVQPSPLSISRIFNLAKLKLCPH